MNIFNKLSRFSAITALCFLFALYSGPAEGQILKKLGNKIERSVERRVDNRINRGVEKGLDKVEDGVDKSAKEAVSSKENAKATPKKSTAASGKLVPASFEDASPYSESAAKKATASNGMVLVGADCGSFAWFKKGAMLEYEIKMQGEKDIISKMEVTALRREGNKTIATIAASGYEELGSEDIELDYVCSGNQLYFDLSNLLQTQMEKAGAQGHDVHVSFEGGLTSIPKNLYPGLALEDAVFTMTASSSGMNMEMTSYLLERKVEKREKITTPAGTFDCVKITGTRSMKMNMMGKDRVVGKPGVEEMWFAPKVGIVKSVSKDHKGKVQSEQQLIKYKL